MARRTQDEGRTITRKPIPQPATAEDVLEARHRDRRYGTRERPATDAEMLDLPAAACQWRQLSEQERHDLASEVRERIARSYGWHPPIWRLDRGLLARDAATVWKDNRQRIADVRDASAATDAIEDADAPAAADRTDAAACWAGESLPAAATDWRQVAEGVGVDPESSEGVAVFAALSGYGTGAEIATVLGITKATARKRLQRGRDALAERWEDADALRDALADADALDAALADAPVMADGRIHPSGRWPINGTPIRSERVRLDALRRAIRRMLDRIATVDTLPHAASIDREPRTDAPATVHGPAALARCQPERIAVRYRRREYLPNGTPTVPLVRADRTPDPTADADADARWIAANAATTKRTGVYRRRTEAYWTLRAMAMAEDGRARLANRWHENQCHGLGV